MRIPLHPAGTREILIISLLCGGLAAVAFGLFLAGLYWCWLIGVLLVLLWAAGLAFFRDPQRLVPAEPGVLVAPADGKVVEIARLEHQEDVGGPATRIGIFLSVFDVHVNRSPCSGMVRAIRYQRGRFLDARDPQAGKNNEANTIVLEPADPAEGIMIVRQIAGRIARRIVCTVKVGDRVERGQRLGLIKFGSRTELIMPGHDRFVPMIEIGDHTRGAATILARRAADKPLAAAVGEPESC